MIDRRQFLTRSGAAVVAAGALGGAHVSDVEAAERQGGGQQGSRDPLQADGQLPYAVAPEPAARLPAVPFHGPSQAGIANPPPPAACFVSFNVTAANRAELIELLQTLTARARFLTHGGIPADLGPVEPPSDSGTLGPEIPADGLTVTVGFGATLFDNRFGIAARTPKHLTPMTSFPNDDLKPDLVGGDLLLQICAGSPDTAIHALRDIARHTRGDLRIPGRAGTLELSEWQSRVWVKVHPLREGAWAAAMARELADHTMPAQQEPTRGRVVGANPRGSEPAR